MPRPKVAVHEVYYSAAKPPEGNGVPGLVTIDSDLYKRVVTQLEEKYQDNHVGSSATGDGTRYLLRGGLIDTECVMIEGSPLEIIVLLHETKSGICSLAELLGLPNPTKAVTLADKVLLEG